MSNIQYHLEYTIKSSPAILFNFLSSPTGLSQWFADTVNTKDDIYIFNWKGVEEEAAMLDFIEDEYIKFKWSYHEDGEFFSFRVEKSEVTNDTILTITDFAEEDEIPDQKRLWDSQIGILARQIGAG